MSECRTMATAKRMIEEAGFRFNPVTAFVEEDGRGHAASIECDRRCFNHPKFEVRIWPGAAIE